MAKENGRINIDTIKEKFREVNGRNNILKKNKKNLTKCNAWKK